MVAIVATSHLTLAPAAKAADVDGGWIGEPPSAVNSRGPRPIQLAATGRLCTGSGVSTGSGLSICSGLSIGSGLCTGSRLCTGIGRCG